MSHRTAQLKAVLFDMGDTIVDLGEGRGSYEERVMLRVARVYDALTVRGVKLPGQAAFGQTLARDSEAQYQAAVAQQIGIDAPTVMRRFLETQGLPTDDDIVEAAAEAYCRGGPELVAPLRLGAIETLTTLKARGLRLGAISNTIQPGRFLATNLQRWGLTELFDVRVYSSDIGVAKPNPKIFQVGLERMGVAAENAVYVGDRLVPDVGGAHGVGMKAVLIEVAHRVESHQAIVPDAQVKELPELLDVLPTLFDLGTT
jgi:HAD superfamily hydrolase (TIGR01509 family)